MAGKYIRGINERNGKIYVRTEYKGIKIYRQFSGKDAIHIRSAEKYLRDSKSEIDRGEYTTQRYTLEQAFLEIDKTLQAGNRRKRQTSKNVKAIFYNHIAPILGGSRYIDTFTREDLRRFQVLVNESDSAIGTQINIIGICKQIFKKAYNYGWIVQEIGGVLSAPSSEKKTPVVISDKSAKILLKKARELYKDNPIILLVFSLGYYHGMRAGEICGLQWQDINFKKGVIHIQRQYNQTLSEFTGLKTKASDRCLPMRQELKEILKTEWNRVKDKANPDSCVVTGRYKDYRGVPITAYTLHKYFRWFMNSVKIKEKKVTIHTLRKTCGTNIAKTHPYGEVAAMYFLGHSRLETTRSYYLNRDKITESFFSYF